MAAPLTLLSSIPLQTLAPSPRLRTYKYPRGPLPCTSLFPCSARRQAVQISRRKLRIPTTSIANSDTVRRPRLLLLVSLYSLFPMHLPDILVFSSVPQSDEIVPSPKLPSSPATPASHCLAVQPPRALRSRHHARLDVPDLLVRAQLLISSISDTPVRAHDHAAAGPQSSRPSLSSQEAIEDVDLTIKTLSPSRVASWPRRQPGATRTLATLTTSAPSPEGSLEP
jgi:hypothetical protein